MTFATTCIGLFPIMWATGAGSDVMKRIAAPMVGGIFTSFVLELLVYPAIYEVWRWGSFPKNVRAEPGLGSPGVADGGRSGGAAVDVESFHPVPRSAEEPMTGRWAGTNSGTGCAVALLLLARAAAGQTTVAAIDSPAQTVTVSAPPLSVKAPAAPPKISYADGQLKIDALDSTLADVLTKVAALTGASIEVPPGATAERMPIVELGPGPVRRILASLLSDSTFDYVIQASDLDPERVKSVLLIPREKGGAGANATEVAASPARGPFGRRAAPPEAPAPEPVAAQPEPVAAAAISSNPPPAPTQPPQADQSTQPPQPDQPTQFRIVAAGPEQSDETGRAGPSPGNNSGNRQPTVAADVPAAGADGAAEPSGSLDAGARESWKPIGEWAGRVYLPAGAAVESACWRSFLRL